MQISGISQTLAQAEALEIQITDGVMTTNADNAFVAVGAKFDQQAGGRSAVGEYADDFFDGRVISRGITIRG